ncbi:glycosyltransferase family 9 protein [Mucilaginibacter pedocola]|uniref:Glycosyl transferase family 9 n=1 Tax=Mucilaginibacter pedocola TaxID=1792845 RepID=A0A1S9PAR4_9SPHI|nr:glycosyltransferase family 9 protein [Mucilaginibacter pedocola]OOQ58076.1 hypothetical protein BC343_10480 [Mucilaginibacter pedocola]
MFTQIRTIAFTLKQLISFGIPSHILYFGDSLGDNLLLTTLAANLHHQGYKNVWVKCNHRFLFEGCPHIKLVLPFGTLLSTPILALFKVRTVLPQYTTYNPQTDRDDVPEKHIILKMADALPLNGTIKNKPVLILSDEEIAKGALAKNHVVITCSTSGAVVPMGNKEWITERYQQVVNTLHRQYKFIQLGTANDPKLDNVTDMRGKLSVRESAAVLKNSQLVITHVGFMMHLARAVDSRAVIIYGGRETPSQSGYGCFRNIYNAVPCSPCWLHNKCDFEKRCMTEITPEMVTDAALKELDLYGTPLPVDELLNA